MPKELEARLKEEAREMGLTGEHADRYVYGTMRKIGWKPSRKWRKKAAKLEMNSKARHFR